ncbi:MAG TPA: arsenate reductase ArsC [Caulobacteraceae bacterium]|jgi:protein-tyrosine-phosphatase|nr:arsenate reductase ArsC [Caulobacteraceae bacterium]
MTSSLHQPLNVLFLGTGNTARSIMAEAILNRALYVKFRAFSAGLRPSGLVSPHAIRLLARVGDPTGALRSKSWAEFAAPSAPRLDFVFALRPVADDGRPVWPGQPMTADWDIPDPLAIKGSDAERALAFVEAYRMLNNRIRRFASLPIRRLHPRVLQRSLDDIGCTEEAAEAE